MKKANTGSMTENSIDALAAVIDDLRAQGIIDTVLVAALAEVAVRTATTDRATAQMHLDALAAITKAAVDAHRGRSVMNMAQAILETP